MNEQASGEQLYKLQLQIDISIRIVEGHIHVEQGPLQLVQPAPASKPEWDERFAPFLDWRNGDVLIRPKMYVKLLKLLPAGKKAIPQASLSRLFNTMETRIRRNPDSTAAEQFRLVLEGSTGGYSGINGCAVNLSRLRELAYNGVFESYLLGEEGVGTTMVAYLRRFVNECHTAGVV